MSEPALVLPLASLIAGAGLALAEPLVLEPPVPDALLPDPLLPLAVLLPPLEVAGELLVLPVSPSMIGAARGRGGLAAV